MEPCWPHPYTNRGISFCKLTPKFWNLGLCLFDLTMHTLLLIVFISFTFQVIYILGFCILVDNWWEVEGCMVLNHLTIWHSYNWSICPDFTSFISSTTLDTTSAYSVLVLTIFPSLLSPCDLIYVFSAIVETPFMKFSRACSYIMVIRSWVSIIPITSPT